MDLEAAWYRAHREVAQAVGWSRLDQARFWRLIRKEGRSANVLPACKPLKLADYQTRFAERVESDEIITLLEPYEGVTDSLAALTRYGTLHFVTGGKNASARRKALESTGLAGTSNEIVALDPNVRRRPGELKTLAAGDPRTLVVSAADDLIRAAGEAELFTVGIACGACVAARLHQGGADVVYGSLDQLVDSLAQGGQDLIRAGLLPAPLG